MQVIKSVSDWCRDWLDPLRDELLSHATHARMTLFIALMATLSGIDLLPLANLPPELLSQLTLAATGAIADCLWISHSITSANTLPLWQSQIILISKVFVGRGLSRLNFRIYQAKLDFMLLCGFLCMIPQGRYRCDKCCRCSIRSIILWDKCPSLLPNQYWLLWSDTWACALISMDVVVFFPNPQLLLLILPTQIAWRFILFCDLRILESSDPW